MDLLDLKYLLGKKGLNFTAIDRLNNLREGSCRLAVAKPHKKGEQALSEALNIPANKLFPERYDNKGNRYEPQPRKNYNYSTRVEIKNDKVNSKNDKVNSKNTSNFVAKTILSNIRQSYIK